MDDRDSHRIDERRIVGCIDVAAVSLADELEGETLGGLDSAQCVAVDTATVDVAQGVGDGDDRYDRGGTIGKASDNPVDHRRRYRRSGRIVDQDMRGMVPFESRQAGPNRRRPRRSSGDHLDRDREFNGRTVVIDESFWRDDDETSADPRHRQYRPVQ